MRNRFRAWLASNRRVEIQRRLTVVGGLAAFVALLFVAGLLFADPRYGPFGNERQRSATRLPAAVDGNVPIASGWYFVVVDGYSYTFDVPTSGFEASPAGDVQTGSQTEDPHDDGTVVFLGNPSFVYTDPCHWKGTAQTTGTTAADFVAAVGAVHALDTLQLGSVTIDGRSAKQIRIGVANPDFAACDDQEYRSYEGRIYQGAYIVDDLTVIDLEGGDRAVVLVSYRSGVRRYIWEAMQYMVNSLHIAAVTP
jgi:hypothetical protein